MAAGQNVKVITLFKKKEKISATKIIRQGKEKWMRCDFNHLIIHI